MIQFTCRAGGTVDLGVCYGGFVSGSFRRSLNFLEGFAS